MSRFFDWLRQGATTKLDRRYVSEFTHFMDHFLEEHPEVIKDQRIGWRLYWDKRVDQTAQEKAEHDSVPADGYGFYASAWGPKKDH